MVSTSPTRSELGADWSLSVSGRYNVARVTILDESGESPELNGINTFRRFNPAVGITYSPSERLTAYAAYNEGTRAPTALELTCADPEAPCKLPNNFLADPPLEQVVAKTVEIGARGRASPALQWSAALYRTVLDNDIQFISSGGAALNAGYFANVGQTRRQGLELGAIVHTEWMELAVHYSLIDATYQTAFVEHSPSNSSADANGDIVVQPGDRIAGIPRQSAKLRVDFRITPQWDFAFSAVYNSGVYARGDENNQDVNGKVPGYTVVNFDTRCASLTRSNSSPVSTMSSTTDTPASACWVRISSRVPGTSSVRRPDMGRLPNSSAAWERHAVHGSV